jgi:hypothetical protein
MLCWTIAALALGDFLDGDVPRRLEEQKGMICQGHQEDLQLCLQDICPEEETCTPVNGEWSEWGVWSSCSCSGVQERHRTIQVHAVCGGLQVSGPEIEAQDCAPTCHKDEPKMCEVSPWSDWTDCDRQCGGGERFQHRTITQHSENCGEPCEEPLRKAEGCNMQQCGEVAPCVTSDWSAWTACSATCGGGQMLRFRSIVSEAIGDAPGCSAPLLETMGCSEQCCDEGPQDCEWAVWTEWSSCSATCGGGVMSRIKALATPPRIGGKMCTKDGEVENVMEYKPCGETLCNYVAPVDGQWAEWGEWSSCSRTCGEGFRFKHRAVASEPAHGGKAAEGDQQLFETCDLGACNVDAVDCQFGSWSAWAACSATFKGTRSRSRQISAYAERGGLPCDGPLAELEPCNDMTLVDAKGEPQDCEFDAWIPWGYCSKTCGGGTKSRSRVVKQPRLNGGKACEGETVEGVPCNQQVCRPDCDHDEDCEWGPWLEWSACSNSCGGGERTRYRTIATPAMNFGKECSADESREVSPCNTHQCGQEVFCIWGDWSAFSPCSATCGAGTKKRSRGLELSPVVAKDALDTSYLAQLEPPTLGLSGAMLCSTLGLATVLLGSMVARVFRRSAVPARE